MTTATGISLFLAACHSAVTGRPRPEPEWQPVAAVGRTVLGMVDGRGDSVRVTLSQHTLDGPSDSEGPLLWGGDVGELPKHRIASIRVQAGSIPMIIPLSAYGDLGDVTSAYLRPSEHGFSVGLLGGETATAYAAVLEFDRDHLVRRMVHGLEFPEHSEVTRYSFIKSDN